MCPHLSPDDDIEDLDLRAHYRAMPAVEPQLATAAGPAVRGRLRRPHGTWHPGWGVAGSVLVVAALLAFTDYSNLDNPPTLDDDETVVQNEPPAPDDTLTQPPELGSYTASAPPALPASLTSDDANAGKMVLKQVPPPAGPDATSRIEYIRNLLRNDQRDAALVQLAALHRDEAQLELPPDLQALVGQADALPEPDQTESGPTTGGSAQ